MKKAYFKPTLETVILNVPQLLAESNLGIDSTPVNASLSDARFGDIDFDDEEEY